MGSECVQQKKVLIFIIIIVDKLGVRHRCIPTLVPLEGGSLTIPIRSASSAQAQ